MGKFQTGSSRPYSCMHVEKNVAQADRGAYIQSDVGCLKTKIQRLGIRTWNVRSLYATAKLDNAIEEANT